MYAGQAPWDIGKPQKPFIDMADRITGSVLDASCGTGENALFSAGWGCRVTGIDFIEQPIQRARRKAAERGGQVRFLVKDALTLKDWSERFDNVIDSGLIEGGCSRRGRADPFRAGPMPASLPRIGLSPSGPVQAYDNARECVKNMAGAE